MTDSQWSNAQDDRSTVQPQFESTFEIDPSFELTESSFLFGDFVIARSTSLDHPNPSIVVPTNLDRRQVRSRVRIRVPSTYRPEPVLSTVISRFGLTVNVLAALLGSNRDSDGWFDLELNGTADRIQNAMLYFNELDLEVWSDAELDGI